MERRMASPRVAAAIVWREPLAGKMRALAIRVDPFSGPFPLNRTTNHPNTHFTCSTKSQITNIMSNMDQTVSPWSAFGASEGNPGEPAAARGALAAFEEPSGGAGGGAAPLQLQDLPEDALRLIFAHVQEKEEGEVRLFMGCSAPPPPPPATPF
jgi:hypothetical protein